MPRAPRILFCNAYYHVINRGRKRETVFHNERDFRKFLGILKEESQRLNVQVAAYCLMSNHYHILLKTPEANLPQLMHHINGKYVQYYNRKYKIDGALFCGRYKAFVIDEENYLIRVVRYIHLNPVEAKMVNNPDEYEWVTHKYYKRGGIIKSSWLLVNSVLEKYSVINGNAGKAYREHLREGVDAEVEKFYSAKKRLFVLGDDRFRDEIMQNYLNRSNCSASISIKREEGVRLYNKIRTCIAKKCGCKKIMLDYFERGGNGSFRQMLFYVMRLVTMLEYKDISKICGALNAANVRNHCYRFRKKVESDRQLLEIYTNVLEELGVTKDGLTPLKA